MTNDEKIKNVTEKRKNIDKEDYKKLIQETVEKIEDISVLISISTVVKAFYKDQTKLE